MNVFQTLNHWLERVFVGERGYTVYADGRMEKGTTETGDPATIKAESFEQVFGRGAVLNGTDFFVPRENLSDSLADESKSEKASTGQLGLHGRFKVIDGQLAATAYFTWNRYGVSASMYWIWFCLFSAGLDILSSVIGVAQGTLTTGDAVVLGIVLVSLCALMFLPRVLSELKEKLMSDARQPVIAKLSALVQHEGGRSE